ncbi:hypothetical protein AVEN_13563-1 [Araneus ventricosus]|uniref:Uncharacterized protein n=1 Tax=Araneus ventricosus TaxID=182803 RepID=A0A4Y2D6X5_ARAVE|nr:hypothetical protein AVEN_13563-1 [Araneus ventricosus]
MRSLSFVYNSTSCETALANEAAALSEIPYRSHSLRYGNLNDFMIDIPRLEDALHRERFVFFALFDFKLCAFISGGFLLLFAFAFPDKQVRLCVSSVVFYLKFKTHSNFTIVNSDYASSLNYPQQVSMATTFNNMFYKSAKTLNELVMRLGNQTYDEINIIIDNAEKPKKMPETNPFLIQDFVKKSVSRHEQIENMKYTRQGKIQFTTKDPI